jgi:hypothetical protein
MQAIRKNAFPFRRQFATAAQPAAQDTLLVSQLLLYRKDNPERAQGNRVKKFVTRL